MMNYVKRVVACDKCTFSQPAIPIGVGEDFRGGNKNTSVDYVERIEKIYFFDDRNIAPVLTNGGWCGDCRCVTETEKIPTSDEIEARLEEIAENIARHNQHKKMGRKFWQEEKISFDYLVLENRDSWIKWAASRERPRCLRCGSRNLLIIDQEMLESGVGNIGLKHPYCGGNLLIREEPLESPKIRISARRLPVVLKYLCFTPDGVLLGFRPLDLMPRFTSRPSKAIPGFVWLVGSVMVMAMFWLADH